MGTRNIILIGVAVLAVALLIAWGATSGTAFIQGTLALEREAERLQEEIDDYIEQAKLDSITTVNLEDTALLYRQLTLRLKQEYDSLDNIFVPQRSIIDDADVITDYNAVARFITDDPYRVVE